MEQHVADIAGGEDGVFATQRLQLALEDQQAELTALFDEHGAVLTAATKTLLERAQAHSADTLARSVQSFDQGRILLAAISMISATVAAWFWVGNAVVRRLSHLSERMRNMAQGDLETPCQRSAATR